MASEREEIPRFVLVGLSQLEEFWENLISYILENLQIEPSAENITLFQDYIRMMKSIFTPSNMDIKIEIKIKRKNINVNFEEILRKILQILSEDESVNEYISQIIAFSQLLVPFVQDLCDAYPGWIENHTLTIGERDRQEKIIAMLKRLKDNIINVESSSNNGLGLCFLLMAIVEVVDKILQADTCPPVELLRATLDKYPEIQQFMKEIVLKITELFHEYL